MTVTLSTAELYKFQEALQQWYKAQFVYVIDHTHSYSDSYAGTIGRLDFSQRVKDLMDRYEKENPRPDWKSLL